VKIFTLLRRRDGYTAFVQDTPVVIVPVVIVPVAIVPVATVPAVIVPAVTVRR